MNTRLLIAWAAALALLTGCDPADDLSSPQEQALAEEAPAPVESAQQKAMREAIEQARREVDVLLAALAEDGTGQRSIEVKVMVSDPATGVSESLPMREVTYSEGKLHGRLASPPLLLGELYKEGDACSVAPDQLIDWHIIEDGKMRGGYTLRVLRASMTPEDRKALDEELGVTFE